MDLKGRRFLNSEGRVCTVKDFYENVTIFEDGSRVDTRMVTDPKFYTAIELPMGNTQRTNTPSIFSQPQTQRFEVNETINPDEFLNRRYVIPLEAETTPQSRNTNASDYYMDDNKVASPYDEDVARENLAKKYEHLGVNKDQQILNQAKQFASNKIINQALEEDGVKIEVNTNGPRPVVDAIQQQIDQEQMKKEMRQQIQQDRQQQQQERPTSSRQIDPVTENNNFNEYLDPTIALFKKAKLNTDFKFSININKKIPKLETIQLLEDSWETSIIEYLANEFTDSILRNPDLIKEAIMKELHRLVDGPQPKKRIVYEEEEEVKPVKKTKPTPKSTPKPKVENTAQLKRTPKVDIREIEQEINEGIEKNNMI